LKLQKILFYLKPGRSETIKFSYVVFFFGFIALFIRRQKLAGTLLLITDIILAGLVFPDFIILLFNLPVACIANRLRLEQERQGRKV